MRLLLDSNIVIYFVSGENTNLLNYLNDNELTCSSISYIEVLGYYKLDETDKNNFEKFFEEITLLPIDNKIMKRATKIRQSRSISLGDSIVAATALENDLTLVTRNISDFTNIKALKVINPFKL